MPDEVVAVGVVDVVPLPDVLEPVELEEPLDDEDPLAELDETGVEDLLVDGWLDVVVFPHEFPSGSTYCWSPGEQASAVEGPSSASIPSTATQNAINDPLRMVSVLHSIGPGCRLAHK